MLSNLFVVVLNYIYTFHEFIFQKRSPLTRRNIFVNNQKGRFNNFRNTVRLRSKKLAITTNRRVISTSLITPVCLRFAGGGSSSGSPATGYMQHSSPTPSSTPGSDISGQPAASPGWDVKPQQPIHPPPHPAPHPHPPHNYLPQYSWYPTDNPGLLT